MRIVLSSGVCCVTEYYVALTGSKNNAGDYLIKDRAFSLLSELRPDRSVVDMNGWEAIDERKLDLINRSKALILLGGPALQTRMVPNVYQLPSSLEAIKVPIATMGIGWKSNSFGIGEAVGAKFNKPSLKLIERLKVDGLQLSVRDYHSYALLRGMGCTNVQMTGCPATYALGELDEQHTLPGRIGKIGFSLGVSFIRSKKMRTLMIKTLRLLADRYPAADVEVVFHHSLSEQIVETESGTVEHLTAHRRIRDELKSIGFNCVDISGSADNLKAYYDEVDLHIGFRVHAHIYMTSMRRPSVLFSEDCRGAGLKEVLGGHIYNAIENIRDDFIGKIARKFRIMDTYNVPNGLTESVIEILAHDVDTGYAKFQHAFCAADKNFSRMKSFIDSLP